MIFCDTTGKECKMNNCYSCASCDIYKEKQMNKSFRAYPLDQVEGTETGQVLKKEQSCTVIFKHEESEDIRGYNVGESDYSKHKIQPWDLWIEYKLNPFDADIVKRVLRHKKTDSRKMDYEKIIHICKERIRQIETGNDPWEE